MKARAGIGIALLAALTLLANSPSDPGTPSTRPPGGAKLVRELGQRGGMTAGQIDFLTFVAYGESGLKPDVGLGDAALFPPGTRPNTKASQSLQVAEAYAARKAYDRNRGWLGSCPHPESAYAFGSGGLFAFLPVYALAQFKGTALECASPYSVFDPAFAMAAAYGFARGLTMRAGFLGTWESLRSGWGLPSAMDDLERIAKKSDKWKRQLNAVGLPASRLKAEAPAFPRRDLVELYQGMGGGNA